MATAPTLPAKPDAPGILLIETDAALRDRLAAALRRRGFAVWPAADADSARELAARAGTFQLVLAELSLPGTDGPTLIEELRRQNPAIQAFFLANYCDLH